MTDITKICGALFIAVVVLPMSLVAADWPQLRGPTHDGHSAESSIAESWPTDGPPVLWAKEIGAGYSGFVVVGDRAFTLAQSLHQQFMLCLDANTGETIWTHRYALPFEGGLYPGPRSTPTVSGDRVVFATPDGVIGCVRASDGGSIWQSDVHRRFRGKGTDFGYSASPLVIDDLVIVPVGGHGASVVALRLSNGEVAWQSGDSPASYATPIPIEWQGHKLVIALLENSLAAFDRKTGELWFEVELSNGYDEHSAQPLYREPHLFIAAPFKAGARLFELVADESTGRCRPKRVWESFQLSNDVASSVLVGDVVFGFDLKEAQSRRNRPSRGEFRCVDWLSGKVRWSDSKIGQANVIVVGDKLLLFNDAGELMLARVSDELYQELARTKVFDGEVSWTLPAFSNGRLFVRSQSQAVCLFIGNELKRETSSSRLTVRDIPKQTRFDPTSLIGGEREFPAMTPEWRELRAWFGWSAAMIVVAGLVSTVSAATLRVAVRRSRQSHGETPGTLRRVLLFGGVAGVSVVGGPWLNARTETYLFFWPLTLWVGFQLALLASLGAKGSRFVSMARLRSYLTGFVFFGLCGGYYHLTRLLGLATEWSFLVGFLPSLPVVYFAGKSLSQSGRHRWLSDLAWSLVSFTAYFWSSAAFVKWWLSVGT
jgi:outer membrane protein assembly factor BamB